MNEKVAMQTKGKVAYRFEHVGFGWVVNHERRREGGLHVSHNELDRRTACRKHLPRTNVTLTIGGLLG